MTDQNNWFNSSIQVGMPVTGSYTFFDSGYQLGVVAGAEATDHIYFFNRPGKPVLNTKFETNINSFTYSCGDTTRLQIQVNNDSAPNALRPGDSYVVASGSEIPFPSNWHDWTGDPSVDPDGIFYPSVGTWIELFDPSGKALGSPDLPLTAPNLAAFPTSRGKLAISDNNDGTNYALATFQVNTLEFRAVPEPGHLAWFFVPALTALARLRLRR